MCLFKSKITPITMFILALGACTGASFYEAKADVVISDSKPIVQKSIKFQSQNTIKVPDREAQRRKEEEERRRREAERRASRGTASVSKYNDRTLVAGSSSSLVSYSKNFLGRPYVWGAEGPRSFDCSGFVQYVFRQHGIYLNRTTFQQVKQGRYVSKSDLKAGDLVFFNTSGSFTHVGIYIGSGKFIHASSGSMKVIISSLNKDYYKRKYAGARRILK